MENGIIPIGNHSEQCYNTFFSKIIDPFFISALELSFSLSLNIYFTLVPKVYTSSAIQKTDIMSLKYMTRLNRGILFRKEPLYH